MSSFNYFLQEGIQQAINHLVPPHFKLGEKIVKLSIQVGLGPTIKIFAKCDQKLIGQRNTEYPLERNYFFSSHIINKY